jgi:hypothetical protein
LSWSSRFLFCLNSRDEITITGETGCFLYILYKKIILNLCNLAIQHNCGQQTQLSKTLVHNLFSRRSIKAGVRNLGTKMTKKFITTAFAIATFLVPLTAAAQAPNGPPPGRGPHNRPPQQHVQQPKKHRSNNDALIIGGAVGFVAGILAGSANGQQPAPPPPHGHRPPPPPPAYGHRPPPPHGRDNFAPWTPRWHQWCSQRYRSFDPRSGTFIGRDGREYFCEVR